jgi:hypothetical protein
MNTALRVRQAPHVPSVFAADGSGDSPEPIPEYPAQGFATG